jgi:hypothetical protein
MPGRMLGRGEFDSMEVIFASACSSFDRVTMPGRMLERGEFDSMLGSGEFDSITIPGRMLGRREFDSVLFKTSVIANRRRPMVPWKWKLDATPPSSS